MESTLSCMRRNPRRMTLVRDVGALIPDLDALDTHVCGSLTGLYRLYRRRCAVRIGLLPSRNDLYALGRGLLGMRIRLCGVRTDFYGVRRVLYGVGSVLCAVRRHSCGSHIHFYRTRTGVGGVCPRLYALRRRLCGTLTELCGPRNHLHRVVTRVCEPRRVVHHSGRGLRALGFHLCATGFAFRSKCLLRNPCGKLLE